MGDLLPGRVFWNLDSCQVPLVDSVILDKILPSIAGLVRRYGSESVVLRGFYNMDEYAFPTDMIWMMEQNNVSWL